MEPQRVLAIWMEAAEIEWIEPLVRQGKMPTFDRLRRMGAFGRLEGPTHTQSETAHPMLMSGCRPEKTGGWDSVPYDPKTYRLRRAEPFEYDRFQPFYALDESYPTVTFDISETPIFSELSATQVVGWGAHAPKGPRASKPESFVQEIVERFGDHPGGLDRDLADAHSTESCEELRRKVLDGLRMREAAFTTLLKEHDWRLFFADLSEPHSAGHFLTYTGCCDEGTEHSIPPYMEELYIEIDAMFGRVLQTVPDDVRVVLFSVHGMRRNHEDSANFLLLPELLFRHTFRRKGLDFDNPSSRNVPLHDWPTAMWKRFRLKQPVMHFVKKELPEWASKFVETLCGVGPAPFPPRREMTMNYHPTAWYQPYWHRMKAFALPTYSDGYIRLNVGAREGQGIIPIANYNEVIEDITEVLRDLRLPGSGEAAVRSIIRTRAESGEEAPRLPHADLIVQWNPAFRGAFVSSEFGNFGPVPFYRTGAHTNHGFLLASGPGIPPCFKLPMGSPVDVSATILELLGAPVPEHFDGRPLLSPLSASLRKAA